MNQNQTKDRQEEKAVPMRKANMYFYFNCLVLVLVGTKRLKHMLTLWLVTFLVGIMDYDFFLLPHNDLRSALLYFNFLESADIDEYPGD